jgi:MFS transporter, putative metabolite transport protein
LVVTIGRFYITESANWLHTRGATEKATLAARKLLVRAPQYPREIVLAPNPAAHAGHSHGGGSFFSLFGSRYRRATILASVPWFLQDLGTYGIGIFTPTILATALGHQAEHVRSMSDLIANATLAARGDAMITTLLIIGIVFAVMLADRVGRIRLQIIGFIGCAVGLLVASLSVDASGSLKITLIFAGFMLFDFMTNLGPNSQTYLLAGEVFPTEIRGMGAGFAAAFAKVGAVLTAFLFPILLVGIGTRYLLYLLVLSSLLGAVVTWLFRIETTGVKLDRIGGDEPLDELTVVQVVEVAEERI